MAITGNTELQYSINTEVIEPLVLDYLYGAIVMPQLVRSKDITGLGSLVYKFASHGSLTAAATSAGTDLTPAAFTEASDGTVTAAEVGVAVETTRLALASVAGRVSEDDIARNIANAVASKMETDLCATFASFTTEVGSTGVDLTIGNIEDALYAMRLAKAPSSVPPNFNLPPQYAGYQMMLHERQLADFLVALRQAGQNDALIPPERAGLLYDAGSVAAQSLRGVYMGIKVYASTFPAAVNTSADRSGALFCPAAIGMTTLNAAPGGPVVIDREFHSLGRSVYLVGTAIYGVSVIKTAFGVEIITDA